MPSDLVHKLGMLLKEREILLATAESCTGGLISTCITEQPGASTIFDRGFVTYSNQAKMEMLGVSADILERYGAVSQECAMAMAQGALQNSHAGIAVSVTGIAGPDGGSTEKPIGLVYIGIALKEKKTKACKHIFKGNRKEIRKQAREKALESLVTILLAET